MLVEMSGVDLTATTPKERARKQLLDEDEWVDLLSQDLVRCLMCGKDVKLSKKSRFDPVHWNQHVQRCPRKHLYKRVQKHKAGPSTGRRPRSRRLPPPTNLGTLENQQRQPTQLVSTPPPTASPFQPAPPLSTTSSPLTPLLSPASSLSSLLATPSSPPSKLPPWLEINDPNATAEAMKAYLSRSHPDRIERPACGDWHNWNWAQLRPPQIAEPTISLTFDESEDVECRIARGSGEWLRYRNVDHREIEAAEALFALSQSRR